MTRALPILPWPATVLPGLLGVLAVVVIVGLPWPANAFILVGICAGLATLRWPSVGLATLVLVIPLQAAWEGEAGPVHLTLTKTVFAGLILGWTVHLLLQRRAPRVTWLAVPYAAYVLIVLVSGAVASERSAWRIEFYHWVNGFAVYLIAIDTLRSVRLARASIAATAIGLLGLSLYAFQQVLTGAGPPSFAANGVTRAFGTFGQPNPFAGYLDVTVPMMVALGSAWVLKSAKSRGRAFHSGWWVGLVATAAFLGLAADGATQSRGGWLGMAVGIGVVIWLLGGLVRLTGAVVALALLTVVLASPLGARIGDRTSEGSLSLGGTTGVTAQNFAVRERLAHWRAGVDMALDHPWLGVGAGNFNANYREATADWRFRIPRGHAHNAFIQAAAQTGFVGLGGYVLLVVSVAWRLRQCFSASRGSALRPLVVGAIGVCLAFIVHSLVDYLHVHNLPAQLGVIIAIAEIPMPLRTRLSEPVETAPDRSR